MQRLVADHAVERVGHLVGEQARQAEQQIPEDRRDDAVAEILGEALDRGARDPRAVEAVGIAADDMPHRLAPGRQPAPLQRRGDRSDVLEQAALAQQHADRQRLDGGADKIAAAQPMQHGPQCRRGADQHNDRNDAALAPALLAAVRAVQLALEEGDGAAGEHDWVRHHHENQPHLAEDRVDGDAGEQQDQRVVGAWPEHGRRSVRCAAAAINRPEGA